MSDVGIVGCGVTGSRFADAVAAHDDVALPVACDRHGERAGTLAADPDCDAVSDNRVMLARDDVDVDRRCDVDRGQPTRQPTVSRVSTPCSTFLTHPASTRTR